MARPTDPWPAKLGRLAVVLAVLAAAVPVVWFGTSHAQVTCKGERATTTIIDIELAFTEARAAASLDGCTENEVHTAVIKDFAFIPLYVLLIGGGAWYFGRHGYRVKALRNRNREVAIAVVAAGALDAIENVSLLSGLSIVDGVLTVASPASVFAAVAGWIKFLVLVPALAYVLIGMAGSLVLPRWLCEHLDRHDRPAQEPPPGSVELDPVGEPGGRWTRGVCLSGGGVRSATFGLGALQGFEATEGGDALAWRGAQRVTAISGGAYMAGAMTVARTPRPGSRPHPPGDAWAPGSLEERHLRDNLGYLGRGEGGLPGSIVTLISGLTVNVAVLLTLLWLAARPLGWLVGSCLVQPTLQIEPGERETVACAWVQGDMTRSFVSGWAQWGPPLCVAVLGAAALVGWVIAGRLRATSLAGRTLGTLHRVLGPVAAVLASVAAALALVLIVVPWAMFAFPELLQLLPGGGGDEANPTGVARVIQVLTGLGIVGALWAVVKKAVVSRAARLGGVLVALFGVLLGGQWATSAAQLGHGTGLEEEVGQYAVVLVVFAVVYALANPEWWALAPFYRGRLRSAYATRREGRPPDERVEAYVGSSPDPALEEPSIYEYRAAGDVPRLTLCAAANVSDHSAYTHYGIPAYSLVFDEEHVAFHVPRTGEMFADRVSCHATSLEHLWYRWDSPRLTTMAAVAISGAAAAPGMGRFRLGTSGAFLALANITLGVWLPNPAYAAAFDGTSPEQPVPSRPSRPARWQPFPRVRVGYLLKEMAGLFDAQDLYLYCTDGGHWENTGIVEMVRDGEVNEVVCLDASGVASHTVTSLAEAINLAPLECGVEIRMRFDTLRAAVDETVGGGYAPRAETLGVIRWHDGELGLLWYAKPVLTEGAATGVRAYAERDADFPATGTLDQFFSEEQFEGYRALGFGSARNLAAARAALVAAVVAAPTLADLRRIASEPRAHWAVHELDALLTPHEAGSYRRMRDALLA